MSFRMKQKKMGLKRARALLLGVGCASLLGASMSSFAQDALLQNQEGEILLQPDKAPVFEGAPVDPSYDKIMQAPNKRKAEQ